MFSINFKLQNNDSLYSQGRGYGFFTPEMAVTSSGTAHEQSLKSGGWNTRHFYEEVSDEGSPIELRKSSKLSIVTCISVIFLNSF